MIFAITLQRYWTAKYMFYRRTFRTLTFTINLVPVCRLLRENIPLPITISHNFNTKFFISIFSFFFYFVEKQRLSLCVGCGGQIHDQYILRVAPDLEWHAACLKCQECRQFLDESCTCFVRDGKTYCKRDYVRWVSINWVSNWRAKKKMA